MSSKSATENYPLFTLGLCNSWANTYYRSDADLEMFITRFMIELIKSEDLDRDDVRKKSEAEDELEFLVELMKEQHLRSNVYGLT